MSYKNELIISLRTGLLACSFFFLGACDFTPQINKKILIAQEYLGAQKYEEAIKEYNYILTLGIANDIKIKIFYQLGEIFSINLKNYEKAVENYLLVQKLGTDPLWQVKAQEKIGEIYLNFLNDAERATKIYQQLVNFAPKLKRQDYYQFQLAKAYTKVDDLDTAIEIYKTIQKNALHEYFVNSFYEIGLIYFYKSDWRKAVAYWKEYIKREERRDRIVQTKFMMANAYETMQKLKTAYGLYYSILGEYPNTGVIEARLNSIYARRVARKR